MVTDAEASYRLWRSNGALNYSNARELGETNVILTGTARQLTSPAVYGPNSETPENAGVKIGGVVSAMDTLASLLDPVTLTSTLLGHRINTSHLKVAGTP